MSDLFNPEFIRRNAATQMRDKALESVGSHNEPWTSKARSVALMLASKNGEVNINDVLRICPRPNHININATGSVMRDKRLKLIGYTTSLKRSSHARKIGVYSIIS